jgi:cysteine-rich repeat protein
MTLLKPRAWRVLAQGAFTTLATCWAATGCDAESPRWDRAQAEAPSVRGLNPQVIRSALTGGDTCATATLAAESLSAPIVVNDTTVGQTDDIDLPTAQFGDNGCSADVQCTGTGSSGGLRGDIYPGSGIGPDRAFRFQVDSECTLTASMLSPVDLGLYLLVDACASTFAACACASDSQLANQTESISAIAAKPGVNYYLLVDGYKEGANPASEGTFQLTLSRTAGTCNLVIGCGDSNQATWEACDDGNNVSCDGCSADCQVVETGCADGVKCGTELCDDGNTTNCDGCRSDCMGVETGCGDGFTCPGEDCEDGNIDNGDGCSSTCEIEVAPPEDSGVPLGGDAGADLPNTGTDGGQGGNPSVGGAGGSTAGSSSQAGQTNGTELDGSVGGSGGAGGAVDDGKGTPPANGGGGTGATAPAAAGDDGGGCALSARSHTDAHRIGAPWLALLLGLTALASSRRRANRLAL